MDALSPAEFSYETEDKGLGYSSPLMEEPFSDLFDHGLTHTFSTLGDHGDGANDLDWPDLFTDGETTSSASYFTDSTSSASSQPAYTLPQDRFKKETAASLTRSAFQPQNYGNRARREKLQPAVSGLELLLNVEGQARTAKHTLNPPHSAPPQVTTLPLRRKPRFKPSQKTSIQDREQKHSKPCAHARTASAKMISPSYGFAREMPQPQEWARSLEQLSLQPVLNDFPNPSPSTGHSSQQQSGFPSPRHVTLRDQFLEGEANHDAKKSYTTMSTLSPNLDATFRTTESGFQQDLLQHGAFNPFEDAGEGVTIESIMGQQPSIHHAASWTSSIDAASITPTARTETTWSHGLPEVTDGYYSNGIGSKSAPALPYHTSSTEDFGSSTDILNVFQTEDPSVDYTDLSSYDMASPQYPIPPLPESNTQERRASSPPTTSPARSHRRSKSAHRRKSSTNLHSVRNAGAHMGFVNFTPSDSKRILTGVAPSGSSKTKARRQQEENEKKRKMSLAMLKAVEEAGVDTESFRKRGLL
ncbi:MAG: hypothetical protein Q9174_003349 [Haloplaca sp. 1 TL-2023]